MRVIPGYRGGEGPCRIKNPYLDEIQRLSRQMEERGAPVGGGLMMYRKALVERYSFSVPTPDVLGMIALYGPIVEIGAGSGYWAYCLSQLGTDIVAYDRRPPEEGLPWPWGGWDEMNPWFESEWFPVHNGDAASAALHPGRSLLLCWPLPDHPMAADALEHYRRAGGRVLIYVGDPASSGDARFHEMRGGLVLAGKQKLRGWPGVDDWVEIRRL